MTATLKGDVNCSEGQRCVSFITGFLMWFSLFLDTVRLMLMLIERRPEIKCLSGRSEKKKAA